MLRFKLTLVIVGLLLTASQSSDADKGESVQETANALFEDLIAGKVAAATKRIATHSEARAMSTRIPSRAAYETRVGNWVKGRVGEFSGVDAKKLKLELRVTDVRILPAGGKRKREVVVAIVGVFTRGKPGLPVFFAKVDGQWKMIFK